MRKQTPFELFGLFGYPLGHTLSPHMHEAAFRELGIDANYLVLELTPKAFRKTMRALSRVLLSGFNVTVPYKETVLKYLDKVSTEAKAIGAVNTVYKKGNLWFGTNTDMEGFLISLAREGGFISKNKKIVVLGAGGASRAVTYGLSQKGAKEIVVVDAVPGKARGLVGSLKQTFRGTRFLELLAGALELRWHILEADLVINATPLGLKKADPLPVPPAWIPKSDKKIKLAPQGRALQKPDCGSKLFMDLIYNPAETAFLKIAKKRGHRTLNGLGMLVLQGARAFQYWTGKKPPIQVMRKAALAAIYPKEK